MSNCSFLRDFVAFGSRIWVPSSVVFLGHVENLIVLEFGSSVADRHQDGLSGRLQELALLELQLALKLLALDIGDEEGGDQILN